jgi:hypothetical protein
MRADSVDLNSDTGSVRDILILSFISNLFIGAMELCLAFFDYFCKELLL